jgi:hypothetical protein
MEVEDSLSDEPTVPSVVGVLGGANVSVVSTKTMSVGGVEGIAEGLELGSSDGTRDGWLLGSSVILVGYMLGKSVGTSVGLEVGVLSTSNATTLPKISE